MAENSTKNMIKKEYYQEKLQILWEKNQILRDLVKV